MTNEKQKGAAPLLPPEYPHNQITAVKMILVRDYAGYCLVEDTRQDLIFNGIPCKTWTDVQALQSKLPDLTAKNIISDADAAAVSAAVDVFEKERPDDETIYKAFKDKEIAVTRLREMLRTHSDHLAEEGRESGAQSMINAITNAAGLAVKSLKVNSVVNLRTLKSIDDVYSLLLLACPTAGLWDGGRPNGAVGDIVADAPDPFGFPKISQLYEWAEAYKLVSLPPEVFAADFDEYTAAVSEALVKLNGLKVDMVLNGQKWPQPQEPPDSYADELFSIPRITTKAARGLVSPNDTLSNHLTSQTADRLQINGGEKKIPDTFPHKLATKTVLVSASLESEIELSRPINEFDRAILNGVYSQVEAGNEYFTAAMVYRTITGKTDREYVSAAQMKQVDEVIARLSIIKVWADLTESATQRGMGGKYYDKDTKKWKNKVIPFTINNYLLAIESTTTEINGEMVIAYHLLKKPPLYEWAKRAEQVITFPVKVMDIKKVKGGKVGYQSENATQTRTAIKSYLLRRLQVAHARNEKSKAEEEQARSRRGRKKAGKKEGPYIEHIKYESVLRGAGVDWDGLTRPMKVKYRKFIADCLINWQQDESLAISGFEFEEYKEKNKIIGLRITYPQC